MLDAGYWILVILSAVEESIKDRELASIFKSFSMNILLYHSPFWPM